MSKPDDKFKDLVELSKQHTSPTLKKNNSSSPISSPSGTESDSVQYNFLGSNIIVEAVDESKHPVSSPAFGKPKRSAPKSRAKKADDAVREDNKKRQKYFRDQMKELFEKLASVLRPPLEKDEKTKKVLQCAIDYIESLHSLLEYYQNLTQQVATLNPELFQFITSTSPPPTPSGGSQNPISVMSPPRSPNSSTRTDQSSLLSQGTGNSSRRAPSSPGTTDASSTEVSWISQVLQFSSPSRSPNTYLSQLDVVDLEKMLSGQSPQYSPGNVNMNYVATNTVGGSNAYRSNQMQQQQSTPMNTVPQQQMGFNQYSSFLSTSDPFASFGAPASPIKPPSSPSHSWKAPSMDLYAPPSPSQAPVHSNLLDDFQIQAAPSLSAFGAPPSPSPAVSVSSSKSSVAIKLEPGNQPQRSHPITPQTAVPRAPQPAATSSSKSLHSIASQPQPQSRPQAQSSVSPNLYSPSNAVASPKQSDMMFFSLEPETAKSSKPSLACEEEAFDWSSVSNTPTQTPDRKPIPSLEALSDSLQSLTVSKANGLPTVVIKQEK